VLNSGLYSSDHSDWNTPECVLERVRKMGPIGLDPCSNAQSTVRAATEWRLERGEDGLRLDWRGHGLVFVNPPYGDALASWLGQADAYGSGVVEIIALVPHRTDTAAYHDNIRHLSAKCEWRGRLKHPRGTAEQRQTGFHLARGFGSSGYPELIKLPNEVNSAPFPSVILYWGDRLRLFEQAFGGAGKVWFHLGRKL
jgi:hypothetical protein